MWSKHIYSIYQKKKRGLGVLVGCTVLGGSVIIYVENYRLRKRLRLVRDDVAERERGGAAYIYLPQTGEGDRGKRKSNRVYFPWLKSRSKDPHSLLKLAESEDHAVRLLGVNSIAQPHRWTDADYCMLAQALGSRALIGLARMPDADPRFFLPQPTLPPTEELIEDELRHLISSLPMDNLDRCTKYFTSSALQEGNQSKKEERGGLWCFGGNGLAFTSSISPVPIEIVELFCLQALEKHSTASVWTFDGASMLSEHTVLPQPQSSWVLDYLMQGLLGASTLPSHCAKIVQQNGLAVFQRIYETRPNNIKILRCIARILSNLAVHENLHLQITKTGWVTVLHKWLNSKDLALSLYAAKALANLDLDFGANKKYVDGVFLYYPQKRYSEPVYADIVFVHGLMGGPFRTWRQDDSVLKKLLEERKLKQAAKNTTGTNVSNISTTEKPKENISMDEKSKPITPQTQQKTVSNSSQSKETGLCEQCTINSANKEISNNMKNVTNQNTTNNSAVNSNNSVVNGNNSVVNGNNSVVNGNNSVENSNNSTSNNIKEQQSDVCKDCGMSEKERKFPDRRKIPEKDGVKQMLDVRLWDPRQLFGGGGGGGKKSGGKTASSEGKKRSPYTFCWPKDWLPQDIPNVRIVTVEYDTHLSEWAPKCPYDSEKRALATRSKELLEKLRTAGIGDRPVIWIGHSMGGLLIKQMLVNAATDVRFCNMLDRTHGIVFYSVPHKGSPLADYGNSTITKKLLSRLFYPSVEVEELKMDSPQLLALHKQFKELMFEVGVPLLSLAEGQKTNLPLNKKEMIVPVNSSDPEFGEFYVLKEQNHLNICKPENDLSPLYQLTLRFLSDCLPLHRVPHILKATVPGSGKFVIPEDEVS